ncbi:hypothetical protein SAMN05877753_112142 [Bacillus oleivorans]|uniref:Uncharacterized protein n=1 Tax=Bacillus oleivorans TaxID=1448271 RepID=A0A285D6Q7_9BACI|nr:hypothetical protein [Bacillus oleivorans]SNX75497.1 hypothetical protein SAMN05877753_112142 [Bacillus oleivorans]
MFNQNVFRLVLGSTILSSIFSIAIIVFSAYHHMKIQQLIKQFNQS